MWNSQVAIDYFALNFEHVGVQNTLIMGNA